MINMKRHFFLVKFFNIYYLAVNMFNRNFYFQDKDVPFKEKLPLSLKNIVSNTSMKGGQKACMDQMMEVIGCLSKFDQNQSMCSQEINAFQKCYSNFKATYDKNKALR